MSEPHRPTGLARRARRLSDAETERRILDAAVATVNRTGLTVSLEHISFEDVIRNADVSRSSAYRRWPHKDLFFSDLLKELATAASPGMADDQGTLEQIKHIILDHLDWFESPELRGRLVSELVRQGALLDFASIFESRDWRTYFAVQATFLSVTDRELRDELQAILARTERGLVARVAAAWQYMAELVGYRLRPEMGASFETLVSLLIAQERGLVLMSLATPDLATHQLRAAPVGAAEPAAWSLTALGAASIAAAFLEPNPDFVWTEERRAAISQALESAVLTRAVGPQPVPRTK